MNDKFTIQRWPNKAGLMRGPNMMTKLCNKCLEHQTHGFWFYGDGLAHDQAIFVCDDCLNEAKKTEKGK